MSKKYFYLIAMAVCPLIADSFPVQVAEGTQVQILERANQEESEQNLSVAFSETRNAVERLAHGNTSVISQYDMFEESLQKAFEAKKLKESDVEFILSGVVFAAEKHQFQTRKNAEKTPYVGHPIGVADSIISIGQVTDKNILVAALLHDTVEDTETSFDEISQKFGDKVAGYVREVTDDKSLSTRARKKMQIIHAFHKTKGAAIIKLSDKLYNLNNLLQDPPPDWKRERIDQYFQWAQAVIENLPSSNESLKEEIHRVIAEYWAKQAK